MSVNRYSVKQNILVILLLSLLLSCGDNFHNMQASNTNNPTNDQLNALGDKQDEGKIEVSESESES